MLLVTKTKKTKTNKNNICFWSLVHHSDKDLFLDMFSSNFTFLHFITEKQLQKSNYVTYRGMSTIVVTPPAAAALVALQNPSQDVRPGSFTCTWQSTMPGITTLSPTSNTWYHRNKEPFGVFDQGIFICANCNTHARKSTPNIIPWAQVRRFFILVGGRHRNIWHNARENKTSWKFVFRKIVSNCAKGLPLRLTVFFGGDHLAIILDRQRKTSKHKALSRSHPFCGSGAI